jgi:dihydroxyacetone kinase-like protein
LTTADDIRRFLERYAALIEMHADELTELDAAIGDADHGANMQRGMRAVLTKIGADASLSPSAMLKAAAMALISNVGGAAGPLYGTALLRASAAVAGKNELAPADVGAIFRGMLSGVQERGHAVVEDKTMVDTLVPATQAFDASIADGGSLRTALSAALAAARQGSDSTIPLVARKGRASYLGERARGNRDPGSRSSMLLFEAGMDALGAEAT